MRRTPLLRSATLAGLLILPFPEQLIACAFHTVLPDASVSEQIADSVEVIAARPSRDDPFRYETVAVLKGTASDSPPPHLVDSGTRARLAVNEDEAVLFVRDPDGSWTRLLAIDDATRPLVDLMVARAAHWTAPDGAAERRDVFADLLDHPDPRLRRLALRELDALPYAVLRGGTYPVAEAELLRGISDIDDMPYAPIRILLLGLSGSAEARGVTQAQLERLTATGIGTNLGAWLTAAIESGGPDSVARLERLVLNAPGGLTQAQLTDVVRALSVQSAEGDPALRGPLDVTLRRLVSLRPEAAPLIAQAFGAASDFSQETLIRDLIAARAFTDRRDLMAAAAYVTRAPNAPALSTARPGTRAP